MHANGLENREIQKKTECQLAVTSFIKEIDKFAFLVSGIRNQIESLDKVPNARELQNILLDNLEGMNFDKNMVISYVDSNHVFQYSITRSAINANTLSGKTVQSLRDTSEIARLNNLMESDQLHIFPPLNLIEGWGGIPLSFRFQKEGKTLGYFAPIVDINSVLDEIYTRPSSKEFAYKFSYNDNLIFDRHSVYDGNKIYNNLKDTEFYKNFEPISTAHYVENSLSRFGAKFNIAIDYKDEFELDFNQTLLIRSWYFINTAIFFAIWLFMYWQNKKRLELENQRDQLEKYNEAMERFNFATSHDLKEPLRTIGSFSSLLKRKYEDNLDEKGKEYFGFITRNVARMSELLDDLLKYNGVLNVNEMSREIMPFVDIINDVKEALFLSLQESNTQLIIEADYPSVYVNKTQIHQVLQNLISNAIKFNDKETCQIHIGYKQKNDLNVFFVKDNGIGINEKYHKIIFESFHQLNKQKYNGSGLGLSICKKIIEQYNGKIWVESDIQPGSTFYFSLPKNGLRK